ncbi:hypothetical protein [Ornithobacterium rhinotracheale]|uniref:hypothetical protein n=1 Tax=Ornithobacterium rhinotracheale TaxID=28251 RepID=UPI001FF4CEB6|nr:hypothetical protein [Ornithobacterium rhinotracheale]MCK0199671.1 hypothetical protein [Ornithobacterium rhinotracheale]
MANPSLLLDMYYEGTRYGAVSLLSAYAGRSGSKLFRVVEHRPSPLGGALSGLGDKNAGGWNPNPGNPNGYYWSSSPNDSSNAWNLNFNDSNSNTNNNNNRNWGRPLRCRQDRPHLYLY